MTLLRCGLLSPLFERERSSFMIFDFDWLLIRLLYSLPYLFLTRCSCLISTPFLSRSLAISVCEAPISYCFTTYSKTFWSLIVDCAFSA